MPKLPTEDQIKVTRDSINSELYISVSTQSSLINPKWKERNKILGAFTIRMGTPINEIKDKDLPSPSLRGIGSNKDSEGQMQSKALEKIKSRISRNKENKEHFTIQEESKPEEVKQRKILPDIELNKILEADNKKKEREERRAKVFSKSLIRRPQSIDYLKIVRDEISSHQRSVKSIENDMSKGFKYAAKREKPRDNSNSTIMLNHLRKEIVDKVAKSKEKSIYKQIENCLNEMSSYIAREKEMVFIKKKKWSIDLNLSTVNISISYINAEEYLEYKKQEFEGVKHFISRTFTFN